MLSSLLYPPSRPDTERLRAAVGGKTVLLTGASFGIGEALGGKAPRIRRPENGTSPFRFQAAYLIS